MAGNVLSGSILSLTLAAGAGGLAYAGISFMSADPTLAADMSQVEPVQLTEIPPPAGAELLSSEATRRPVFHASRQPIDDPGAAPVTVASVTVEASATNAVNYKLRGVVIGDGSPRAGLLQPGSNELVWVRAGEELEGWTIDAITMDGVRLRSGEETAEINIVENR